MTSVNNVLEKYKMEPISKNKKTMEKSSHSLGKNTISTLVYSIEFLLVILGFQGGMKSFVTTFLRGNMKRANNGKHLKNLRTQLTLNV